MADTINLEVQERTVVGKKVKALRAAGKIPAVVYGPKQDPIHLLIDWKQLRPIMAKAGGTNLIDLDLGSNKKITTLIRDVARDPLHYEHVLHVDFYAVNLTETLVTSIPVVIINEEETLNRIGGQIVLEASTLDVETLPAHIPSEIVVDVSSLQEIGDMITVADLPALEGVTYITEPDMAVVRTEYLAELPEEEEEEEEALGEFEDQAEPELVSRRKEEDFEEEEE
ncbi:MAG: 50S ribosomal protein L25 [Chloroflexi bacterium]|nr:50S ribosomal protein L25 [Chloroflexota bacterium]